jgi:hypothetical protein
MSQSLSDPPPITVRHPYAGLTLRSACFGLALSALINIAAPYSKHFLRSTYLASDFMPLGLVFPFLLLVTLINGTLKALRSSWGLTRPELIVVFAMGLIATTIPTIGLTGTLITTITSPFYYATSENGWADLFHDIIPPWLTPAGENEAVIRWFFEGLPKGQAIPWQAWVMPLLWWLSLVAAVFFSCVCLIVILRKQWIEQERLPYPLVEVPLLMTEQADQKGFFPPFMRSKLFWTGFSIPCFIVFWNIAGFFIPHWPSIALRGQPISFGREFPGIPIRIYFPVLGFAYLINVHVAFSIWFFYLLSVLQMGLYNRFGLVMKPGPDPYSTQHPALSWQGFGAMTVLVLWGLWISREHLIAVWRKARYKDPDVDDSDEMLSYRTAVFGFFLTLFYLIAWLYASGMSVLCLILFVPAVYIIYLGITRVVVEGGLVFVRPPLLPQSFAIFSLGTTTQVTLTPLTSMALNYGWFSDIKATFIVAVAHASKMIDRARVGRKAILLAVLASLAMALTCSVGYTIYMGYKIGAYNMDRWLFQSAGRLPFTNVASKLRNPFDPDFQRLIFMGIGATVMAGLTFLRYRFTWWPLAPLGYPIAGVQMVRNTALTIFIAWAFKVLLLKIGGNRLYQRALPFFFGLMVGFYTGLGIAWIVDFFWFPGGQGHYLYGV